MEISVRELLKQINDDPHVKFSSGFREMLEHPAYKELVSFGMDAVKPLLREIESDRVSWTCYAALHDILQDKYPKCPEEIRGKLYEIQKFLVDWGRENKYL